MNHMKEGLLMLLKKKEQLYVIIPCHLGDSLFL